MRVSRSTIALLALPTATIAVSLSDFTPRVANLPSACKSVYTTVIDGCSGSDFGEDGCSKDCVEALQSMVASVKSACGGEGITGNNIIVAFLDGGGPGSLCGNAAEILGGGSSSSSSAAASPTKASSSSTSKSSAAYSSSSTSSRSSSSSAILSGTATASSLPTSATESSSGLLVDTSSTPTAAGPSSTSSSDESAQSSSDHSGGGSPFDTQGNMSSAPAACSISLTITTLTAALMLFVLLR